MKATLARWAFAWRMATSCLYIQLQAYREMHTPVYLPDDATEDELAEMAAEQRAITAETRADQ